MMTTNLFQLFSPESLAYCLNERLVVAREHPRYPLTILNYTERCQYEPDHWNSVTLACRGLIYHSETFEVVARPFRKFFNYGQAGSPQMAPDTAVEVTDKLDGSLGILYPTSDGWAVATRGAFESEQAVHATALFRQRYSGYQPPDGVTVLFEIVYPANRIVLDYGEQDDLVLLGGVEIGTGRSIRLGDAALAWPGPHATRFDYATLGDALDAPQRPNAEGLVIYFPATDERVKVKQEDYVALHRIVTGLNERTVWEHLSAGKPVEALLEPIPDEFHGWVREVVDRLTEQVWDMADEIGSQFASITLGLPAAFSRKDFALAVASHPLKWGLFAMLDKRTITADLWKRVKPEAKRTPTGMVRTEATA